MEQKTQRNLNLLFKELESQPQNYRYYLEIGKTYCLTGNFESALDYHTKGLESLKRQKNRDSILLNSFYAEIAHIKYASNQSSDVLNTIEEYFSVRKNRCELDLQMYFLEAMSYYKLEKYAEAIGPSKKYIDFYKEYHKGSYRTKDSVQYEVNFSNHDNFRLICINLVLSLLKKKNYTSADHFLKQIPISDWNDVDPNFDRRLSLELNLMAETKDYSPLPELFKQLNESSLSILQLMLESQLEDEEKRNLILREMTKFDIIQSDYISLLKLRYDFYQNQLKKQPVEIFIAEIKEWTPLYADAIYFALYCELDISFLASRINAYDLNQLFLASKFLHFSDLSRLIYKAFENIAECVDINSQLWLSFLYLTALISDQLTKEQTIRLFQAYSDSVGAFLTAVYKEEILTKENSDLLPIQLRVGYYCHLAAKALESDEKGKYVESLKTVLKLNPGFKNVIEILLEDLRKSMDKTVKKSDSLSEFEKYAVIVKENIKRLISAGQLAQAAELLSSYEQLLPGDKEIGELRKDLKT